MNLDGQLSPRRTKTAVLVAHTLARRAAALEPGDTLPPERVLLSELDVGRSTLREALRLLELQGVVTIKAGLGGGPVVARPDHQPLADTLSLALQASDVTFSELIRARRFVESELARLAALSASDAEIADLEQSVKGMADQLADESGFLTENLRFHEICASAAHNRILQLFHGSLKSISDGHMIGIAYSMRRRYAVLAAHRRIAAAVAHRDAPEAHAAMDGHMEEFERYVSRRYPETLSRPIRWTLNRA